MFGWGLLLFLLCIMLSGCIYLFFLFDKVFPEPARPSSEPQREKVRISWETKWNPERLEVEPSKRKPVKNKRTKAKTPRIILSFDAELKKKAQKHGQTMEL